MKWLVFSLIGISVVLIVTFYGCTGGDSNSPRTGPSVSVVYQSNPIADVQIRLHDATTGSVVAQALTSSDGQAYFSKLPYPEPTEYAVSLDSVGDGGWTIDEQYTNAKDSGLRLAPLASNEQQQIDLPEDALQSLGPEAWY